jgi:hypothetical protein
VSGAGSNRGSMHCSSETVETSAEPSAEHEVVASAREGRRVRGGFSSRVKAHQREGQTGLHPPKVEERMSSESERSLLIPQAQQQQ